MNLTRRQLLASFGAAGLLALWPASATFANSPSDTRLLVVLLRGGMDGLHALPMVADQNYRNLRARLLGDGPQAHPLDGTFGLHPKLDFMSELYAQKQLLPIVAVAPPYRQRSHFEAQDCVENGTATPSGARDGWMNRCVAALPGSDALAVASVMPLIMRGTAKVETWSPPLSNQVNPILLQRLQTLYAADPTLASAFEQTVAQASGEAASGGDRRGGFQQLMAAAARFMSAPNGARIGFVEDSGWDTHSNEANVLDRKFSELDAGLRAFHDGATTVWPKTVIVICTEFGRTAAVNGTIGTDHGVGTTAFLVGGAVNGGRVAGDWPGLKSSELNENRDLRATSDLRSVFRQVLTEHLGMGAEALDRRVFPGSAALPNLPGSRLTAATIVHVG